MSYSYSVGTMFFLSCSLVYIYKMKHTCSFQWILSDLYSSVLFLDSRVIINHPPLLWLRKQEIRSMQDRLLVWIDQTISTYLPYTGKTFRSLISHLKILLTHTNHLHQVGIHTSVLILSKPSKFTFSCQSKFLIR